MFTILSTIPSLPLSLSPLSLFFYYCTDPILFSLLFIFFLLHTNVPSSFHIYIQATLPPPPAANAAGLLTTKITESPLKNILLTYRSLLIAVPLLLLLLFRDLLPPLEYSVHISFTSSSSLVYIYI